MQWVNYFRPLFRAVRAAMIRMPGDYPWSSVHANLASRSDPVATPHETFLAIAPDRMQRAEAYRVWLRAGVNDDKLADIRQHIKQERALGSPRFQAMAEKALGRSVIVRQQGRPRRQQVDES